MNDEYKYQPDSPHVASSIQANDDPYRNTRTPPPTSDRDDLAAILAKHPATLERNRADDHLWQCLCGQIMGLSDSPLESRHRAHVAQMVLESDWLRDVKADAWKEGADTVYEDWSEAEGPWFDDVEDTFPNPHRADRVDAEDGGR